MSFDESDSVRRIQVKKWERRNSSVPVGVNSKGTPECLNMVAAMQASRPLDSGTVQNDFNGSKSLDESLKASIDWKLPPVVPLSFAGFKGFGGLLNLKASIDLPPPTAPIGAVGGDKNILKGTQDISLASPVTFASDCGLVGGGKVGALEGGAVIKFGTFVNPIGQEKSKGQEANCEGQEMEGSKQNSFKLLGSMEIGRSKCVGNASNSAEMLNEAVGDDGFFQISMESKGQGDKELKSRGQGINARGQGLEDSVVSQQMHAPVLNLNAKVLDGSLIGQGDKELMTRGQGINSRRHGIDGLVVTHQTTPPILNLNANVSDGILLHHGPGSVTNGPGSKPITGSGSVSDGPGPRPNYASKSLGCRLESNGDKLDFMGPIEDDVELVMEDKVPFEETWGFCLIGCFTGPFPGRAALDRIVRGWGVRCRVIPYGKDWRVFRFSTDEDRLSVFHGGPYMTYGKTLMLKKIDDGVLLTDDLFMRIPVWVKLYDVPLSFWSSSGLSKIASKVGRPLYTDQFTKEKTKMSYARVLVEVDVRLAPIMEFGVKLPGNLRYVQKVEYENYPDFCFHCKTFGHNHLRCEELRELQDCVHVEEVTPSVASASLGVVGVQEPKEPMGLKDDLDSVSGVTTVGIGEVSDSVTPGLSGVHGLVQSMGDATTLAADSSDHDWQVVTNRNYRRKIIRRKITMARRGGSRYSPLGS